MRHKEARCVIHGSFIKHYPLITDTARIFTKAGINIIAPRITKVIGETDGFTHLEGDASRDPIFTELQYIANMNELNNNDFHYFINPEGIIGCSASYELGLAQRCGQRIIFYEKLLDHPAYIPKGSIWKPQDLANYYIEHGNIPNSLTTEDIHKTANQTLLPYPIVTVGSIIVDFSGTKPGQERDILLVNTGTWGDQWTIVGSKAEQRNLNYSLQQTILFETGLKTEINERICTFEEIENAGYYNPGISRFFVDSISITHNRDIQPGNQNNEWTWITPTNALNMNIEPNARRTLIKYIKNYKKVA